MLHSGLDALGEDLSDHRTLALVLNGATSEDLGVLSKRLVGGVHLREVELEVTPYLVATELVETLSSRALRRLCLQGLWLSRGDLEVLIRSEALSTLDELSLRRCGRVGAEALEQLAAARFAPNLAHLTLSELAFDGACAEAMMAASAWPALESLTIISDHLDVAQRDRMRQWAAGRGLSCVLSISTQLHEPAPARDSDLWGELRSLALGEPSALSFAAMMRIALQCDPTWARTEIVAYLRNHVSAWPQAYRVHQVRASSLRAGHPALRLASSLRFDLEHGDDIALARELVRLAPEVQSLELRVHPRDGVALLRDVPWSELERLETMSVWLAADVDFTSLPGWSWPRHLRSFHLDMPSHDAPISRLRNVSRSLHMRLAMASREFAEVRLPLWIEDLMAEGWE